MSILTKIILIILVLGAILIGVGFFLPSKVTTSRDVVVNAPQQTVFAAVNSLRGFNRWSPWAKIDPNTQYTYTGPAVGTGAKMSWVSDHKNVGNGSMEITATTPGEWVETALDFGEQGDATAQFRMSPSDGGTKVEWSFASEMGSMPWQRLQGLIIPIFVGKAYEEGLADLKALVESLPTEDFSGLPISVEKNEPQTYLYVASSADPDAASIGAAMGAAYGKLLGYMGEQGISMAGQPISLTKDVTEQYHFEAGIPVATAPAAAPPEDSGVMVATTPDGMVVKAIHTGPYTQLADSFAKVDAFIKASGLEQAGQGWEVYVSDPGQTAPEELITHVIRPIK